MIVYAINDLESIGIIKMEKFDSLSHAKLSLRYHIVLATKYRKPCLEGLERDVYSSMSETLKEMHVRVESMAIDHGDHIHLLIRIRNPRLSVGHIVMRLKQQSTYDLWKSHHDELRQYYWGKEHKLWSNGYFAATVGHDANAVGNYIEKQKH